jgi:hypothetical protein
MAQWLMHCATNRKVAGSIPVRLQTLSRKVVLSSVLASGVFVNSE